jgi:UTP-glucose-1-phosphate uridylyltransferase
MKTHEENQCSVIGVNEVPDNETEKYGVISINEPFQKIIHLF